MAIGELSTPESKREGIASKAQATPPELPERHKPLTASTEPPDMKMASGWAQIPTPKGGMDALVTAETAFWLACPGKS